MGSGETNGSLGLDDKLILDLQLSLLAEGAHGTRRRTAKIDAENVYSCRSRERYDLLLRV
jgi:hypothetical protein